MFEWANEYARKFMNGGYLMNGQSIEDRVQAIADAFTAYLSAQGMEYVVADLYGKKFYEYMGKGYYSLASPIWANYGTERGMPVSCFGSFVDDTMDNILYSIGENGMLMKSGGGTSGYFGAVRGRGAPIKNAGDSSGSVHFMKMFDCLADTTSQGNVRRGFFSAYQDIEHMDANEFLDIGSEGNPIQGLTTGIVVGDDWLMDMEAGDADKRKLWAKVLKMRSELGYPYIMFRDNANKNTVDVYRENNMKIHASNMCSEIMLPSSEDETFVCVLSSMNLLHYDAWRSTDAVKVLTFFLDTVVTEMLIKAEKNNKHGFYDRIIKFAENHRALGLGVLGWHSYLQSNMIPFESRNAARLNVQIFNEIDRDAYNASAELFELFGASTMMTPYKRRNSTLMAVAPTKSSSFILGQVSQSIEPEFSNCYIKDLAKVKVTFKNPYLWDYLTDVGKDTEEVWDSIKQNDGSVQHLEWMPKEAKEVFKTFAEISPETIISQAAARQTYIDQGQSLNLMIDPDMSVKDINKLYMDAWRMGVKSLYYQYSINASQALTRKKLNVGGCASCEG